MTHRRTRHGLAAAAVTVAAVAFLVAGCDPGEDPSPSPPTSTETTDPPTDPSTEPTTVDYQQQQVDAAKDFIVDLYATTAAVGQDGYENWSERLFPYYSGNPEFWSDEVAPLYEFLAAEGGSTEGETQVVGITATDWAEDPTGGGFDTITFLVCLDATTFGYLDADGNPIVDEGRGSPDHPFEAEIEVMGQPDTDLGWSLMGRDNRPEASC